MEMSFLFALMSDQKQTIDICNISLSYHQPPSYEEKGQQKSSKWDGDPKITIPTNAPPPPASLKHNHTIKALLPFLHCLISAGYLRYLCCCSYLWPSACCFVVTPLHVHPPPTYLLPPPRQCAATFRGVSLLPDPFDDPLMWNVHMPNRCGSAQYGVRWSTYRNMTWHALSNGERWRRNSCWCCRKQSGRDWIKVSGKGLLDGLLFSPIQLDVSLSCQEGITAGWFINTWSDLVATLLCVCVWGCVFVQRLVSVCGSPRLKKTQSGIFSK